MAKRTITLHSMLLEMGTWLASTDDELDRAEQSRIHTGNNKNLKSLVTAWENGNYDEDPEILHQALLNLIPR
jgi:PIN domain nuclease of toxin-antitoxin system